MPLKIVGRSPRQISENRQEPMRARGITMKCEGCNKKLHVPFPYGCGHETRQRLIREAVDEHRRIGCTALEAEAGRKFEIWYPRA